MNRILKIFLYKPYILLRKVFSRYGNVRNYIIFPLTHRKPDKKLLKLKNIHSGEKCFIIATGPSLRVEDVENISKHYITIGLNSIYKLYDKTTFRPNYYVALDPDVLKKTLKFDYLGFAKDGLFFNSMCKKKKYLNDNISWLHVNYQNHWLNIFNPRFDYSKNLKYDKELAKGIYDKYTVTVAAIELAMYMGFNEIYLIGVDCNYTGHAQHFGSDDSDNKTYNEAFLTQKAMMTGFDFINKVANNSNVKIINATRGGMLNIFKRKSIDSIIKGDEL